ncbi:hypothetical protein Misp02_49970 [Microtetraspora sp. NBRC 16547]|nr:hypothetical protein Misp02_49970 [Microtetraspora sp. NBRC 16547]
MCRESTAKAHGRSVPAKATGKFRAGEGPCRRRPLPKKVRLEKVRPEKVRPEKVRPEMVRPEMVRAGARDQHTADHGRDRRRRSDRMALAEMAAGENGGEAARYGGAQSRCEGGGERSGGGWLWRRA